MSFSARMSLSRYLLVGGFAVAAVIVGSVALGVAPTVDATGAAPPPSAVEQEGTGSADVDTGADTGVTDPAGVVDDVLSGDTETIGGVLDDTIDVTTL